MEAENPASKRQRTEYDAAFGAEAVRRVNQEGQAAKQVAQALGMSGAPEQENKHLRAQLAHAEMERDI